jgi:hypothetical protein
MGKSRIRVVVKRVGEFPRVTYALNTLEGLQALLDGGLLEAVSIHPKLNALGVHVYCDEEGKLKNLPVNFPIFGGEDVLCGTAVFSKSDEEGDEMGLTAHEAVEVVRILMRDILQMPLPLDGD